MYCSNCGAQIRESDLFCPNCGAKIAAPVKPEPAQEQPPQSFQPVTAGPVPEAQDTPVDRIDPVSVQPAPVQAKKRSVLKSLLLALCGVAAVAAIIFGVIKLVGGMGKTAGNPLLRAAMDTADELNDYLCKLPNLKKMIQFADRLEDQQNAEGSITFRLNVEEYPIEGSVDFRADLKEKKARADVAVTTSALTKPVSASLYLDEEALMLVSEDLLCENEAIAIPLQDFAKKWNKSALAQMIGQQLPEDLSMGVLPGTDLDTMMTDAYGDQWKQFEDSIQLVEFEGTPHFTDGTVKTVTWDKELLEPMYEKAKQEVEELEDDFRFMRFGGAADALMSVDLSKVIPSLVICAFGEFDENEVELQLRFNTKDFLTGICVKPDPEEDDYMEFLLEGDDNPWEHIILKNCSFYRYDGNVREYVSGDEIITRIEDRKLKIEIRDLYSDNADEEQEVVSDLVIKIVYDDETGRITAVDEDGDDVMDGISLSLKPDGDRVLAHIDYRDYRDRERIAVDFSLGVLSGSIDQPDADITNLLELNEQKLQGLLARVSMKIQKLISQEE